MEQIQLFKPIFNKKEILSQISECLDKGWTGSGFKTIEFENAFKDYTKLPYAHFLNSATSGLHLALELIKHNQGPLHKSLVMTTPLTFISDSHVIKHANKVPYFIDVDASLCMDPEKLAKALADSQKYLITSAVIYVGIGGNTGRLDEIVNICNKFHVPLILDASHMMGTYYYSKHVGTEADYTVFSFQSVKNLPTADSGMLCCKYPYEDELARKLSWLGISKDTYTRQVSGGNWDYSINHIGWKYQGNSIMAAMGIAGLKTLDFQNFVRRSQAIFYEDSLEKEFQIIHKEPNCISSRHLFQVLVPSSDRDVIINHARENGIQLGVHYKCHSEYPMYSNWKNLLPNAELYSKQLISLPIGPHLLEGELEKVVKVLNDYPF